MTLYWQPKNREKCSKPIDLSIRLKSDIPFSAAAAKHKVIRFDISMYNIQIMQEFQRTFVSYSRTIFWFIYYFSFYWLLPIEINIENWLPFVNLNQKMFFIPFKYKHFYVCLRRFIAISRSLVYHIVMSAEHDAASRSSKNRLKV